MYSFTYENNGSTTYLVYQVQPNEEMDTMTLGMLTNNKIIGLAPAVFTQMDSQKFIKYNVSSKISVKQFFEGQVNKKRLVGVFKGIVNAILSAEDYMIDVNSLILDLNCIFSDVSSCKTVLICLPIYRQGENSDLLSFFKNIMFSTQFDQTENCDYVAKIINYLNSTSIFSVSDFKKILDNISSNTTVPTKSNKSDDGLNGQSNNLTVSTTQKRVQQQVTVPQTPINQPPVTQSVQQKSAVVPNSGAFKQTPNVTPQRAYTPPVEPKANDGERISFMYLMQHYNKENAAKYKAQKATKKAKKEINVSKSLKENKQSSVAFSAPGAPKNIGFAVPGQKSSQGYAIPGQNPSQSFSVPTQQKPPYINQPVVPATKTQNQPNLSNAQSIQQPYVPKEAPRGQVANFGETTVLGGGGIGETTVLGVSTQEKQITPHLIRTKNNERINLSKPVFRIGKERSYVDYFVSDNTAVSRSHANIITRDDKYFIVDTNSTNHTYVNGGMIQSNVETPLSHGTKIRLANEDFEFRLY